jgi:integrase
VIAKPVARTRLPRQTRSAVAVLSTGQVDGILAHAAGTTDAALWGTMALAGLRLGEALGLADDDVDLDAALLRVRRTLLSDRSFGPPKSERGLREVPATDRLERLLLSHLQARRGATARGHHLDRNRGAVPDAARHLPVDPHRATPLPRSRPRARAADGYGAGRRRLLLHVAHLTLPDRSELLT